MRGITLAGLALIALAASPVSAQEPAQQEVPPPLEIGVDAPDFALPGAVRHGVLAEPVRLSDYRGKVVVLAFFFRARSRG